MNFKKGKLQTYNLQKFLKNFFQKKKGTWGDQSLILQPLLENNINQKMGTSCLNILQKFLQILCNLWKKLCRNFANSIFCKKVCNSDHVKRPFEKDLIKLYKYLSVDLKKNKSNCIYESMTLMLWCYTHV